MKLKSHMRTTMTKLCSLCLVLTGIMHWTGVSLFLFGEKEFPNEADY